MRTRCGNRDRLAHRLRLPDIGRIPAHVIGIAATSASNRTKTMNDYNAPLKDMRFALTEIADIDGLGGVQFAPPIDEWISTSPPRSR